MKNISDLIKTRKENLNKREENIKKFNEGGIVIANIKCAFDDVLSINKTGVLYNTSILSEHFFIPIEKIKKAEVIGGEVVSEDARAAQATIFDVLSFARKTRPFLVIYYMEDESEAKKIIQTETAAAAADAITDAIKQYLGEHPV
jgi:hypothetical protein